MLFYLAADMFKPRKGYQHTQADLFPDAQQSDCPGRGLGLSSSEICILDRSELTVTSLEGSGCNLDRGDPPPTPPEEKMKMFRLVRETTVSKYEHVQICCCEMCRKRPITRTRLESGLKFEVNLHFQIPS
jgi:hypothetical protein